MKTFHLDILSAERVLFSDDITALVVPAEYGYMGILADHIPLLAHLVSGKITIKDRDGNARTFGCDSNGFLEMLKNRATIVLYNAAAIC